LLLRLTILHLIFVPRWSNGALISTRANLLIFVCDLFSTDLRYDFRGLPEQNYALLCARLNRALADHTKTFQYDLRIKEVIVTDTFAAVRLTWISRVVLPTQRSTTNEEPGLDIFQRQPNGGWKIIRYLAYEDEQPRQKP
jgi:hypothetical protein